MSLIVPTSATRPEFSASIAAEAAISMLRDVFSRNEGNCIVNDNALAYPAMGFARHLAQLLCASGGQMGGAAAQSLNDRLALAQSARVRP